MGKRRETNMLVTSLSSVERGLQGPGVTVLRPETARSSPGQDEARRNPGGGLKRF
jgi:hypothetical protein